MEKIRVKKDGTEWTIVFPIGPVGKTFSSADWALHSLHRSKARYETEFKEPLDWEVSVEGVGTVDLSEWRTAWRNEQRRRQVWKLQ